MSHRNGWGFPGTLMVGAGKDIKAQAESMTEPSMTTVTASLDLSGVDPLAIVNAILEVTFVVDVASTVRTCDLASAASLSGIAGSVLARVIDQSPAETGDKYGVMLTMSRFPRPTGVVPVRTGFYGAIAGTSAEVVDVPPGATGVYVFGSQFAGLTIEQLARVGGPGDVTVAESDVVIGQVMPLFQGARKIRVSNTSGGSSNVSIAFAIDG